MTIHPAFAERAQEIEHERRKRQAAQLYADLEPAWHGEALCRPIAEGGEGPQRPGASWEVAYPEDAAVKDPDAYAAGKDVTDFLALCARCPVRAVCLASAITVEANPVPLGRVTHYVSHEPSCDDQACSGCVPLEGRLRYRLFEAETMPSGVFGGVPGKIRSFYAKVVCTVCEGRGYAEGFMLAGIDVAEIASEFHKKPGWPCEVCKGTGRVPNPNLERDCTDWFTREAQRQGWTLATEGTIAI